MIRHALAVLATVASLGSGFASKTAREAPAAGMREAIDWFVAQGIRPERVVPLGQSGSYRMVVLSPVDGCARRVIALDRADEILSLLRRDLPPKTWTSAELWLGRLEPWRDTVTWLPLRQLWIRLRDGTTPTPALVFGC